MKNSHIKEKNIKQKLGELYRKWHTWFHKTWFSRVINKPIIFLLPYLLLFAMFILLPTLVSALLSLTKFDTITNPVFVGLRNYVNLFTNDLNFFQKAVPNTLKYALLVGPISYILSFVLAWMLGQVTHKWRVFYTICIYSPSITGATMMAVVWKVIFSGDETGYLNYILKSLGLIEQPIQYLEDPRLLFTVLIIVAIWSGMGVGFLAMSAGILNINRELYEAAYIDGIKNRWQEIFYITIPQMKPQMLFGAVMSIVNAFNVSGIAAALSGSNIPPQYSGWMIIDHANDFGFTRYEMGYASAITVVLLIVVYLFNKISYKLFGSNEE